MWRNPPVRLAIGVVLLPLGLILIAGSSTWGVQTIKAHLPQSKQAEAVVNLTGGETYVGSFRVVNGSMSIQLIENSYNGYMYVIFPLYEAHDSTDDSFSFHVAKTGEYVFVFQHGSGQSSADQQALLSYQATSAPLFPLGLGLVLVAVGVAFVFADALAEQRARARAKQAQPSRLPPLPPRSLRPR